MGVAPAISVLVCCHGQREWLETGRTAFNRIPDLADVQALFIYHADMSLAGVRNLLAQEASGRWLCFLDADDELDPGYLPEMLAAIGRVGDGDALLVPSVAYVAGEVVDLVGIPNQGRWPSVNECVIGTVHRRDRFMDVGGFREFDMYEDWDLWLRLHASGSPLVYVPDAVYRATVSDGSRNTGATAYETYWQIWNEYERSVRGG